MAAAIQMKLGNDYKRTIAGMMALPDQIRRKVLFKAVRAAGEPILAGAQAGVPVLYAVLKHALGMQTFTEEGGKTIGVKIGALRGSGRLIDFRTRGKNKGQPWYEIPTRYVFLLELGTSKMEAIPFLRPALEGHEGDALQAFQYACEEGIDEAVAAAHDGGSEAGANLIDEVATAVEEIAP